MTREPDRARRTKAYCEP